MSKKLKKSNLYIGQLVTTTDNPEAQVRTISHIFNNNMVEVQWYEGTKQVAQGIDYSMLYTPTIKQIEYSIQFNGRLVANHEIFDFA
jgi:hypothetical protein